jgi:hypothetical protein
VRHARPEALDTLAPLLSELGRLPGLKEKGRGVFYLRSRAFLHFHEDLAGLFADLRLADEFERLRVTTGREQRQLLRLVREHLGT